MVVISRRRLVVVLLVAAVVAGLALNGSGLLRYPGGPLRSQNADGWFWLDTRPSDQGNSRIGARSAAGLTAGELIYTSISMRNQWSELALVESVRLVQATPGLRLVEARLARPGLQPEIAALAAGTGPDVDRLRLGADYEALPAPLGGYDPDNNRPLTLVVTVLEPGEYSYEAVAVDYRAGHLSFTALVHQALTVCVGPLPEGTVCSLNSEDE